MFREEENRGKKIKYRQLPYKKIHATPRGSLSIRWAMPWPMVARQEVPNGISSTEEKNINHLRRDKLSKNN